MQQVVRDYAAGFADQMRTDVHGNVIAVRNPGAPLRVMLAGHCDQIGLIVQHIDDDGFIYVSADRRLGPAGAHRPAADRLGRAARCRASSPASRSTCSPRKSASRCRRSRTSGSTSAAKSKDEAQQSSAWAIRSPWSSAIRSCSNGRAVSAAMDDKTGLWVVMEALRRVDRSKLQVAVYAVSTVQEEIGLRGAQTSAFSIDPHVGIAVDVTHATDCPTIEKKEEGDVRLGSGPVIYRGPNMNPQSRRAVAATRPSRTRFPINSAPAAGPRPPTPTRSRSTAPAWPPRW